VQMSETEGHGSHANQWPSLTVRFEPGKN
jgi:hypothetical protein